MTEEWRAIPGHPNYEASSLGRIRSTARSEDPRVLKTWLAGIGYQYVSLGAKHKGAVHVLVAKTFHGPRPEGQVVRHLDGTRLNNAPGNLAYGTQTQNMRDAVLGGTHREANKTHCKRGHAFDEANTRVATGSSGFPGRWCRACERLRAIVRRQAVSA